MTAIAIQNPLPTFTGLDGLPLSGGYVYFGEENKDPRSFPIAVFYDDTLTAPASQPLRTTAGYLSNNGAPSGLWAAVDFSVLVLDSKLQQVFYAPTVEGFSSANTAFVQAGIGAVMRDVQGKVRETVSTTDYTSTAVAEAAVGVAGGTLFYPNGSYPNGAPQAHANVLAEYFGPSAIGNSYNDVDSLAVAAKLLRYSDGTNHTGKEGYALFVESRPKGSTDGSVQGSDFGLGVSAIKQNWTVSDVEGQVCGANVIARSGYFKNVRNIAGISKANPAVVTTTAAHGRSNGDTVVIQNVLGMVQVNDARYTIAGVTATTFQLVGINSTAFGTYTSGGIVHQDAGVPFFYNPGDTAGLIVNVAQSSASAFSAILEGEANYFPSGQVIGGSQSIRVQLGAIKKTDNVSIGVLSIAERGTCNVAFQAQNARPFGLEGAWLKFLSYLADLGSGAYEAFAVNQLGDITLRAASPATTPVKTIRVSQTNGTLEVVNSAGTAAIFQLSDAGTLNLTSPGVFAIDNTQVVGPRIAGWGTPTGASRISAFPGATATALQTSQALAQLIADLKTHGLLGA